MKRVLILSCILILCAIIFSQVVFEKENSENNKDYVGVAYNSMTFENETELEKIDVKDDKDTLEITFYLEGEEYKFRAKSHHLKDSNEKAYTQNGIDGNDEKYVNIIVDNGYFSGVYGDKGHFVTSLNEDLSFGFGFIITKSDNVSDFTVLLDDIRKELADSIKQNENTIMETSD